MKVVETMTIKQRMEMLNNIHEAEKLQLMMDNVFEKKAKIREIAKNEITMSMLGRTLARNNELSDSLAEILEIKEAVNAPSASEAQPEVLDEKSEWNESIMTYDEEGNENVMKVKPKPKKKVSHTHKGKKEVKKKKHGRK